MLTVKKHNRTALFLAIIFMIMVLVPAVQAEQAPVLVGAEISNKGDVSITFDQAIVIPEGVHDQFTLNLDGSPAIVKGVEKTNTTGKIKLVLDAKAKSGQAIFIDYVKSDDPALQLVSDGGIAVESFTYDSAADAPEDLTPPALTADSQDNQVGNPIDIEFASNPDWSGKITNIKVDDTSIRGNYTVSDGKIIIDAAVFTEAKDYEIVIKATGYPDAALTQQVLAAASEPEPEQPVEEPIEEPVEQPEEPVEQPTAGLNDIADHWAKANIDELVAMGAISGYPDGSFGPDKGISRAEFAVVLVKAYKLDAADGKVFADTAEHWAKDAIAAANASGIINGYDETTFGPDDAITREQMAVMIAKAAKLEAGTGEVEFADLDQVSEWASSAVAAANQNQLISGYPDGTFRPDQGASRAEAMTVILKALKLAQ
jgi:hypothetical protein